MNPSFDRECSTGSESGWTSYFEHENSFLDPYPNQKSRNNYITIDEDDVEDLSMVSDASSGPPHFRYSRYYKNESSNNALYTDATLLKKDSKSSKINKHPRQNVHKQHLSFLDDTASSPIFEISNNNLALSNDQAFSDNMLDLSLQGHSSNQLEERYGFCESKTRLQKKHNRRIEGKRMG
ncbi:uncharacterized protein LOC141720826 isoform X2 [Apium graveolens]|uniref:uncharacterized protein LOC141720826 isoform X2 n=1 Tax=Apium graveolens TaxID=4045 RepID=UPI003D7BDC0D